MNSLKLSLVLLLGLGRHAHARPISESDWEDLSLAATKEAVDEEEVKAMTTSGSVDEDEEQAFFLPEEVADEADEADEDDEEALSDEDDEDDVSEEMHPLVRKRCIKNARNRQCERGRPFYIWTMKMCPAICAIYTKGPYGTKGKETNPSWCRRGANKGWCGKRNCSAKYSKKVVKKCPQACAVFKANVCKKWARSKSKKDGKSYCKKYKAVRSRCGPWCGLRYKA